MSEPKVFTTKTGVRINMANIATYRPYSHDKIEFTSNVSSYNNSGSMDITYESMNDRNDDIKKLDNFMRPSFSLFGRLF